MTCKAFLVYFFFVLFLTEHLMSAWMNNIKKLNPADDFVINGQNLFEISTV